jgi:hypothetical protein
MGESWGKASKQGSSRELKIVRKKVFFKSKKALFEACFEA